MIPWLLVLLIQGMGAQSGVASQVIVFPDQVSCEAVADRLRSEVRKNRPFEIFVTCAPAVTEGRKS